MLPLGVPQWWLLCLDGSHSQPWAHRAAAFSLTGPLAWMGESHQVTSPGGLCLGILSSAKISELAWELAFSPFEEKKNPKTVFSICVISLNPHASAKVVIRELSVLWRAHSPGWGETANRSRTVTILKESSSLNTARERGHYYTLTFDSHIKEAKIIQKQVLKRKKCPTTQLATGKKWETATESGMSP